jgi:hypothetical protein
MRTAPSQIADFIFLRRQYATRMDKSAAGARHEAQQKAPGKLCLNREQKKAIAPGLQPGVVNRD